MSIESILLYVGSFIFLGFGSSLVLQAVSRLTAKIHASRLSISFLVLGLLTSIPEMALGFSAVSRNEPEIFVGNLIGGSAILILLVIPLLALTGKGLTFPSALNKKLLALTLLVCITPSLFVIDRQVTIIESLSLIGFFAVLTLAIQVRGGIMEKRTQEIIHSRSFSLIELGKITGGIALIFISSNSILAKTHELSVLFHIPDLVTSILILSFGTNLPEISLAIKSVITRKQDIALGDYLGSASANTLIFGVLSLIMGGTYSIDDGLFVNFIILGLGSLLFYQFAKSKWNMNTREAGVLLILYGVYLLYWVAQ